MVNMRIIRSVAFAVAGMALTYIGGRIAESPSQPVIKHTNVIDCEFIGNDEDENEDTEN